jgi:hypothetical protein
MDADGVAEPTVLLGKWDAGVTALAIDSASTQIAVGTEEQVVHVLPLRAAQMRSSLRTLVRRNLTQHEWASAFGQQIPYMKTLPELPAGR